MSQIGFYGSYPLFLNEKTDMVLAIIETGRQKILVANRKFIKFSPAEREKMYQTVIKQN